MKVTQNIFIKGLVISGLCATASYAALIMPYAQDTVSLGEASAGSAALAEDASTEWTNPAGLINIADQQLVFGGSYVMPTYKYNGTGTESGNTVSSNSEGGRSYFYPDLHYAAPISDKWAFGFGVSSPLRVDTDWGEDSAVSTINSQTSLATYDVSTDLAYAITPKVSVGAGVDYVRVVYSDFDKVDSDGYAFTSNASTWSQGWHEGILWQLSKDMRLGLSYHTKVFYSASGTAEVNNNVSSGYRIKGNIPPVANVSMFYALNPTWTLLASAEYQEWDQANTLTLKDSPTNSGGSATEVIDQGFKNNWLVSMAARRQMTDAISLKAGVGYETSPVSDNTIYITQPDGGSYLLSMGMHYDVSQEWSFDLGWTHYFYEDQSVSNADVSGTTLTGHMDTNADVLGAQFVWNMP